MDNKPVKVLGKRGKGDCYKANGEHLLNLFLVDKKLAQMMQLVHGNVTGSPGTKVAGKRFDHCWLELNDVVFDYSNKREIVMRKELYYERGKINEGELKRYSADQAMNMMTKTKNFGPWK